MEDIDDLAECQGIWYICRVSCNFRKNDPTISREKDRSSITGVARRLHLLQEGTKPLHPSECGSKFQAHVQTGPASRLLFEVGCGLEPRGHIRPRGNAEYPFLHDQLQHLGKPIRTV